MSDDTTSHVPSASPPYPGAAPVPPAQTYPAPTPPYPGAAPTYSGTPAHPVYPAAAPAPGYQGLPPQPGYPVYAPARPASGLAITSLICGIAGIALSWLVIPLLASIAAIITGHLALRQTKTNPAIGGGGMAIAGLIMGYAVAGLLVLGIIGFVLSFVLLGAFSMPFVLSS